MGSDATLYVFKCTVRDRDIAVWCLIVFAVGCKMVSLQCLNLDRFVVAVCFSMIIGEYAVVDRYILSCRKLDAVRTVGICQCHIFDRHIACMCKSQNSGFITVLCTLTIDSTAMESDVFKAGITGNIFYIFTTSQTEHCRIRSTHQRYAFHIDVGVAVYIKAAAGFVSTCRDFDTVDCIFIFAVTCYIQCLLECFFKIIFAVQFHILIRCSMNFQKRSERHLWLCSCKSK